MRNNSARGRGSSPQLDRFATLNSFVDDVLATLTADSGSGSAALLWFALFRLASGSTGKVPSGLASERQLSKLTGLSRMTVRAALQQLIDHKLLNIEEEATQRRAPVYKLWHVTKKPAADRAHRSNG